MALETKNNTVGKICSHCKEWKTLESFPKNQGHSEEHQGGRHCTCKECNKNKRQSKR